VDGACGTHWGAYVLALEVDFAIPGLMPPGELRRAGDPYLADVGRGPLAAASAV